MSLARVRRLLVENASQRNFGNYRTTTTTPSGAILPEPTRARFGFLSVISGVVVGILIGATISKNMANFLEENDLFVPSDDDDDDD